MVLSKIPQEGTPLIYKINCDNVDHRSLIIANFEKFNTQTDSLSEAKLPINVSRYNKGNSNTLYLGSTMSDIKKRIKQHLGGGHLKTYSLHLSQWDANADYQITISLYKIAYTAPMSSREER